MPDLSDLAGSADTWAVFVASTLLALAGTAVRRVTGSMQRIGARVGRLEQTTGAEQTRRRQLEAVLLEMGVPLPYWPDDPPELQELGKAARQAARRRTPAPVPPPEQREHQADDFLDSDGYTDQRPAVAVPPLTDAERATAARHRR